MAIVLNDVAQAFPAGHRIRLALATRALADRLAFARPPRRLSLSTGASLLDAAGRGRPRRRRRAGPVPAAGRGRGRAARHRQARRPQPHHHRRPDDRHGDGDVHRERASYHLPAIDLAFEADSEEHYRIREGDPAATSAETQATWRLSRGDWRIRTETRTQVACTATTFEIRAALEAFEADERVAARDWFLSIPRNGV